MDEFIAEAMRTDLKFKRYPYKNEVTHKEIMLPPHAPPEFADRNTLWNSAEAQEKQWNSQLARRFVLAIPREIPPEQYADLIRDYCREYFVSKGMIADFAIHDNHDFDEPKQWEIREINEIMNQCVTGWKYFSNPRMFAGYGRQKGWEREQAATDNGNGAGKTPDGFTPVLEQMELPF